MLSDLNQPAINWLNACIENFAAAIANGDDPSTLLTLTTEEGRIQIEVRLMHLDDAYTRAASDPVDTPAITVDAIAILDACAELIRSAEELRDSNTINGEWPDDESETRAEHDRLILLAHRLSQMVDD